MCSCQPTADLLRPVQKKSYSIVTPISKKQTPRFITNTNTWLDSYALFS
jgi:hypothetical protein